MKRVSVDDAGVKEISHGRVVRFSAADAAVSGNGDPIAMLHDGALIAIAEADGDVLRPKKVFVNA
jgi:hypothetical protein